jgi:hypothetical protein
VLFVLTNPLTVLFLFPIWRNIIAICACAKRDFSQGGIFGAMDTKVLFTQLTVEAILSKWPKTFTVFRNRNTDCIGCLLQKFCSIQDVAESYEVPAQNLIHELEKCVDENYPSQRSL